MGMRILLHHAPYSKVIGQAVLRLAKYHQTMSGLVGRVGLVCLPTHSDWSLLSCMVLLLHWIGVNISKNGPIYTQNYSELTQKSIYKCYQPLCMLPIVQCLNEYVTFNIVIFMVSVDFLTR